MHRRRFITSLGAAAAASVLARTGAAQAPAEFDYIVVGAGSAGCVVANRLSADAGVRVLLLEAGLPTTGDLAVETPGRWVSLLGTPRDWAYSTEEETALGGRRVGWPRGKALGGSSAVNAMTYIRGHRADFDAWARDGATGWDYETVLPVFTRLEDNSRGAAPHRGAGGPLRVSDCVDPHAGHAAFLEAARARGYRAGPQVDFLAPDAINAAGYYQKNIRDGRRHSAGDAFLTPVLSRPNLRIETGALAERLLLSGRRVVGVRYAREGRVVEVRAAREVVLCGGVVNTPKLLMLSGIGPADHLRALGVPVIADLSGVGTNLQDHLKLSLRWNGRTTLPPSTVTAGLFVHSASDAPAGSRPDLQFYVGRGVDQPDRFVTLTVSLVAPHSRGDVRLRSTDPAAAPLIRANYLQDPRDVSALVAGARLARELAASAAYEPLRADEIEPGPSISSPADLTAFVRRAADTIYHPAGTCRMGSGAGAVVDAQLRVRDVEGLRVADASVMPTVVATTTHAACVMIGARAADFLQGRQPIAG